MKLSMILAAFLATTVLAVPYEGESGSSGLAERQVDNANDLELALQELEKIPNVALPIDEPEDDLEGPEDDSEELDDDLEKRQIINRRNCNKFCNGGVRVFQNRVCRIVPGPARIACLIVARALSTPDGKRRCQKFCLRFP